MTALVQFRIRLARPHLASPSFDDDLRANLYEVPPEDGGGPTPLGGGRELRSEGSPARKSAKIDFKIPHVFNSAHGKGNEYHCQTLTITGVSSPT
ncbi:hypothetical protein PCANC_06807 [Puccinia coronata f. sp. avenae]|uniref:Uncharacterized protein n=1 Tax=Puccinia coronata f. sp. avenae TaxID=200324 RepID=A0A2N5UUD1_9BASI|nr:hypothetical protein PCANC_08015 [Puccinia coronata f. sp. avenae]PLW41246.1 hypothetical protein PCANC_06807 [Puccinia coronata f. sp. avenae]